MRTSEREKGVGAQWVPAFKRKVESIERFDYWTINSNGRRLLALKYISPINVTATVSQSSDITVTGLEFTWNSLSDRFVRHATTMVTYDRVEFFKNCPCKNSARNINVIQSSQGIQRWRVQKRRLISIEAILLIETSSWLRKSVAVMNLSRRRLSVSYLFPTSEANRAMDNAWLFKAAGGNDHPLN